MTTPHKSMLIQARDALLAACGERCNAEYNPCNYKEVADALTAAIDSPEPKGLFIDLIAQHEGLAEELRDLPEPYDQQALELCGKCGWKAIVPGEPCLMCERNAKMLVPELEPTAFDITLDEDDSGLFVDLETPNGTVVKFGQKLYTAPGAAIKGEQP